MAASELLDAKKRRIFLIVLLDAGYNHVLSHFIPLLAPGIRAICPSTDICRYAAK